MSRMWNTFYLISWLVFTSPAFCPLQTAHAPSTASGKSVSELWTQRHHLKPLHQSLLLLHHPHECQTCSLSEGSPASAISSLLSLSQVLSPHISFGLLSPLWPLFPRGPRQTQRRRNFHVVFVPGVQQSDAVFTHSTHICCCACPSAFGVFGVLGFGYAHRCAVLPGWLNLHFPGGTWRGASVYVLICHQYTFLDEVSAKVLTTFLIRLIVFSYFG